MLTAEHMAAHSAQAALASQLEETRATLKASRESVMGEELKVTRCAPRSASARAAGIPAPPVAPRSLPQRAALRERTARRARCVGLRSFARRTLRAPHCACDMRSA